MAGSGENGTSSNNIDERASSSFEFNFHTGSSFTSGLSLLTLTAGFNRNGIFSQDQRFSRSPAPSAFVTQQPSSQDQEISTPVGMHVLPVNVTVDEGNHEGNSNSQVHVSPSDQNDRTSDDGYNWRKYGQKLVKGSEFPRSYYKCTFPNCEVKKIFERSPSGRITEIVYKGSHDHPKPQAARRHNAGALMSFQEEKMDKDFSFTGQEDKLNTNSIEPNVSPALSPRLANEEALDSSGAQIQSINDDIDEDDPFSKRRKMEAGFDITPVVKPIREPRVVVQTLSEVDILDDGYRWRKYGQKVVRGNPNPRSYYKCTNAGCPVRKHVERASHDPKAVITTYEGKHNHDVPTAKNSNSNDFTYSRSSNMNSSNSVSLDLGVGINRAAENRNNEKNNLSIMVVQASQIPVYSVVNGGLSMYESRENRVENRNSFQTPNQCPKNLGRILMGP